MSDESDIEDRVASEEDEDETDEVDSEESDAEEVNDFLDVEASESDGQSDEEDDYEDHSSLGGDEPRVFTKFMQLPPELRARIWECFDPDAREQSRVFKVLVPKFASKASAIWEGDFLEDQTAPARAMLATHRESRELALRFYPDIFYIRGGHCGVPYNKETDVVLIYAEPPSRDRCDIRDILSALGNPKIVALKTHNELEPDEDFTLVNGYEGSPRHLLRCVDEDEYPIQMMEWCVSDIAHKYLVQRTEEISGIHFDVQVMYCWPDFSSRELLPEDIPEPLDEGQGAEWWPMIEFSNLARYYKLQDAVATGDDWLDRWSSSADEGQSETEDEYESDGIDDATIDDGEHSSEDEDDLHVVQSESEEGIASSFNGFSPLQVADSEHSGDGIAVGNFSSLEPESPGPGVPTNHIHDSDHDSEHAVSDEEPIQKASRRKRRIISSDDEHDDEDKLDEGIRMPSRPKKRSRVVLSDTEDEDGDGSAGHDREAADGSEDDESEEQESEVSDDDEPEPVKAKPMSLFEKLKQFRDDNPVSPDSGGGSDIDSDAEALIDDRDFDEDSESGFVNEEIDEDEVLDDGEGESYEEDDGEW